MSHAEQRLLKKIKLAGGLLDAEIDSQVFPSFVMRNLIKQGLVVRNSLSMYVLRREPVEWCNSSCSYDEINKQMGDL